jgi:hypothetical protein
LLALNYEYPRASDIIPRLLDVVGKYKEFVEDEFIAHAKDTPAWLFLRYGSLLIVNILVDG